MKQKKKITIKNEAETKFETKIEIKTKTEIKFERRCAHK